MKTQVMFGTAAALVLCFASMDARSQEVSNVAQMRAAVEAVAPEGVTILDVTVADNEVRIIGTAKGLKDMATMMRQMEESDALATPDLEFTSDFGNDSKSFYMTASAI